MHISNFIAVLGLALLLWSGVVLGGEYISQQPLREHGHGVGKDESARGKDKGESGGENTEQVIKQLKEKVIKEPQSASAKTELGYALLAHGVQLGNAAELIEALKQFDEALKIDSKHAPALLGLATVSLRVGVLDKAVEFYQRYLVIKPNDIRALSDCALGLIRLGRYVEAQKLLDRALKIEPKSVPVLMVYAMLERERDDVSAATRYANSALEYAESESASRNIKNFLLELSGEQVDGEIGEAKEITALVHAKNYFGSHPIIGRKLRGISEQGERLRVEVADFPVANMPEVTKQRFSSKISKQFQNIKGGLQWVDIVEHGTNTVLMSIKILPQEQRINSSQ